MSGKTRVLMIGGFLGAGKTTAIGRLATLYADRGLRVAVVTNDQAFGLVDTASLRGQGLAVGEVPGACFCCKFDDLIETMASLGAERAPDLILTEPVGSCTDLVATVVEPLRRLHGDRYEVGGLAVLCKPEHGRKILEGDEAGFSPKAEYIFLKQLEEADAVVINKIDTLDPAEAERLAGLVHARLPGKRVLLASGKTGDGFGEVADLLDEPRDAATDFMEVDYDVYAAGEAELAWLNATAEVEAETPLDIDKSALFIADAIAEAAVAEGFEPAHIKVLGYANNDVAVANLVCSEQRAELSLASRRQATSARIVINARVAGDPDRLAVAARSTLDAFAARYQATVELVGSQHFRPGRPEPTHRLA